MTIDWAWCFAVALVAVAVSIELVLFGSGVCALVTTRSKNRKRSEPSNTSERNTAQSRVLFSAIGAAVGLPMVAHADERTQAAPSTAAASELAISTDRPGFSDGTGLQPVERLNIETGYTFTYRNRDGVKTQRNNAPEIVARVGILEDRLELRALTSGYNWSRSDDGNGNGYNSSANGWSDAALGFKLKITDQDAALPRLAFESVSTLGIGSDGVSNQIAEPTFKLLWSYDMQKLASDTWAGVTIGGNLNVAFPTSNGERFSQGQWSIYTTFPIADKVSGFVEYYGIGPNSKGTDAAHYVDCGGTYLLTPRIQLDARVGFGINKEADTFFTGAGVSFLW